jgi:hypothetical protein
MNAERQLREDFEGFYLANLEVVLAFCLRVPATPSWPPTSLPRASRPRWLRESRTPRDGDRRAGGCWASRRTRRSMRCAEVTSSGAPNSSSLGTGHLV